MAGREENRIFVGGLSAHTTERQLDDAFRRYGKILESVICYQRFSEVPKRPLGGCYACDFCSCESATTRLIRALEKLCGRHDACPIPGFYVLP